jgi:hypothetical protein
MPNGAAQRVAAISTRVIIRFIITLPVPAAFAATGRVGYRRSRYATA